MKLNGKVWCVILIAVLASFVLGGAAYAAWSGTKTVSFGVVVEDPDQGCDFDVLFFSRRECRYRNCMSRAHVVLPGDSREFDLYVYNTGECELLITDVTISDGFEPLELVEYKVRYRRDWEPSPTLTADPIGVDEDYAVITIWYSVPEDTPPGEYQFTVDVTCERAPLS